jgi:thymidylate kinase
MNTKIIFVDGVDKTGKTTLINLIHKKTNYKHIIIDRSIATNYAYSYILRSIENNDYINISRDLNKIKYIKFIYVTALYKDIIIRMKKHNEKDISFNDIIPLENKFEEFYKLCKIVPLLINTSVMNKEKCVNYIISKLRL